MANWRLALDSVLWIFSSNTTDIDSLTAGEDFGQVHGADGEALAKDGALELHQATGINGDDGTRARTQDGFGLGARHASGELGELNGEGSAESTALFRRIHLAQLQALHFRE